jgi:hypothetical protein
MAFCCSSGLGQQMALLNAPEPESESSSSWVAASGPVSGFGVAGASASAIMPVTRKPIEQRKSLAPTDWALLSAGASLRFLDYKSTVKAMSDPANFREVELPNGLVHCSPGLGAFEASTVVANYYAYQFLIDHRHRKLARWGQAVNLAAVGLTVGRNYYELNKYWPRNDSLR